MSSTSNEIESARAILNTYHQVHDTHFSQGSAVRSKLKQKNKELERELTLLKEQYMSLQQELSKKDERLTRLNHQLMDSNYHMARLQEDFEHAIHQLTHLSGTESEK